jgi:CheY-like chemotaxis protein
LSNIFEGLKFGLDVAGRTLPCHRWSLLLYFFTKAMTENIRVLSASGDPNLNAIRADLLRNYGLNVTTAESLEQATSCLREDPFDLLIFGSTLPKETCRALAGLFRQSSQGGKIIEVLPSYSDAPKNQPDAIIGQEDEPASLISVIVEILKPRPSPATQDQWKELCKQAAMEQDTKKLLALVEEINRLLDDELKTPPKRRPPTDS